MFFVFTRNGPQASTRGFSRGRAPASRAAHLCAPPESPYGTTGSPKEWSAAREGTTAELIPPLTRAPTCCFEQSQQRLRWRRPWREAEHGRDEMFLPESCGTVARNAFPTSKLRNCPTIARKVPQNIDQLRRRPCSAQVDRNFGNWALF